MRSGDPFSQLVTFEEGFPDAAVTWKLVDGDGVQVSTGTVTPSTGDVSCVINITGTDNTLGTGEMLANRELSWSYTTSGLTIAGEQRYDVEMFLPLGISRDGVRDKLGLTKDEAPDESIPLVLAYGEFQSTITSALLSAVTDAYAKLTVRHAIEALAALKMLPALQVKLASKEVSGSSQFQRAKIDWGALSAYLNTILAAGYTALNADLDPTTSVGPIFIPVVRNPDPITGTTPA